MTPAARLTGQIREAASRVGARLFNTAVGKFWQGQVIGTTRDGIVTLKNARIVNVGITGQSDTIGWTPYTVTADDVGRTLAVFTAIEIKAGADRTSPEQLQFIHAVRRAGGYAGVARTVDDALAIVS